jgi:hypothetical protein
MTRLVSQVWSPCELKAVHGGEPWTGIQACLGVSDSNACEPGSYSEGAWAVSTALAYGLDRPDCKLAAFEETSGASCLSMIRPSSRTIATEGEAPAAAPATAPDIADQSEIGGEH